MKSNLRCVFSWTTSIRHVSNSHKLSCALLLVASFAVGSCGPGEQAASGATSATSSALRCGCVPGTTRVCGTTFRFPTALLKQWGTRSNTLLRSFTDCPMNSTDTGFNTRACQNALVTTPSCR